ncbi:hypothetical protein pb186bvf_007325 [Paramecium bursaria]
MIQQFVTFLETSNSSWIEGLPIISKPLKVLADQLNGILIRDSRVMLDLNNIYWFENEFLVCKQGHINLRNHRMKKIKLNHGLGLLVSNEQGLMEISGPKEAVQKIYEYLKFFTNQEEFSKKFKTLKMLGKGSYAKVYKVVNKSKQSVFAVKMLIKEKMKINQKHKFQVHKEIDILRCLDHKNLMKLVEVHEDQRNIYIILEYLNGGQFLPTNLFESDTFEEYHIRSYMQQILQGIQYLHEKGIMHRDLKPENIVFRNKDNYDDIVIVDFGLSEFFDQKYNFKRCGSIGYIAPEILKDKPYNQKIDIFSIGVIFYIMLFGQNPFDHQSVQEFYQNNLNCYLDTDKLANLNASAKDLLLGLLNPDPRKRFSAKEALNHDWMVQTDVESQYCVSYNVPQLPTLKNKEFLFNDNSNLFNFNSSLSLKDSPCKSKAYILDQQIRQRNLTDQFNCLIPLDQRSDSPFEDEEEEETYYPSQHVQNYKLETKSFFRLQAYN